MVVDFEDLPCIGQELPADLRQRHRTGGTLKKLHAQLIFQTFDLTGDGGLRHGELLGSPGVVQCLCEGGKAFQLLRVHGNHLIPIITCHTDY